MNPADVIVAVCTYRRPRQLALLLRELQASQLPDGLRVEILVVDNSPDGEGEDVAASTPGPLPVRYVPHGAGNIASGRNATLREARDRARFIALIDDDEVPEHDWLRRLLEAQASTGADVVTGPVLARYPADTPAWLQRDDFFSVRVAGDGVFVEEAVSGNALISCEVVRRLSLAFDESLGTSGGEDQLFFRTARARGARLWYAPNAVVHENVPPQRLNASYLLRREYRKGNTLGLLDRSRPGWPAGRPRRRLVVSAYWMLTGGIRVLVGLGRRDRGEVVAAAMRLVRGAGMVSGLRGRTYALYGTAVSRPVIALVLDEDPQYQAAGHSQFVRGYVRHYEQLGARVVVVLTSPRVGFLARRTDAIVYRSPALRTWHGLQVVVAPAVVVRQLGWRCFRAAPRPLQRLADQVRTAARARRQVDHRLGAPLTPAQSAVVTRTLHLEQPDVVLFNMLFSIPRPLDLPESVRVAALVTQDVVSQRAAQFRARGYRVTPPDFSEADEREALAPLSTVVAIQWDDAAVFERLAPHANVPVVPVAIAASTGERHVRPERCLFVGSGSLANVDGLRWLLDECWSRIRARAPHAELHVVGTVCARVGAVADGVVLRGEVEDLADEYASAAVALVPLRTGSGLKVKIVEALCAGVPVVTTSVGAQGLGGLTPRPFLLADSAEDFADEVVRLLSDEGQRSDLEQRARAAAPRFSPERAFDELDEVLRNAGVALPPPARSGPEAVGPCPAA